MTDKPLKIAVTGAGGLIGRMIQPAFIKAGHSFETHDLYPDWLTWLLNSRFGGPYTEDQIRSLPSKLDIRIGRLQRRLRRPALKLFGGSDQKPRDICSDLSDWIRCFRGCDAVIHLAAIPHPNVPGMVPRDYQSINYDGAVNIYQATREAGVPRFIYASSGQSYFINRFTAWRQFPIREEDADPIHSFFRPHDYGYLKWKFERYLLENSSRDGMASLALRLEMPGLWGADASNLFVQTSIENLQQAFLLSCTAPVSSGAHILNIANDWVPESLINLAEYTKLRWQGVAYEGSDNSSLLSVEKAKATLGYRPVRDGRYYPKQSIF